MAAPIWTLIKRTLWEWMEDRASRLAASLAYYTAFALAPLLIIALGIAGTVFNSIASRKYVATQLRGTLGPDAAQAVASIMENLSDSQQRSWFATISGFAILIYAGFGVFAELQDSLNTIWEVKPRPDLTWWDTIKARLLSFAMVMGIGFLLLVSLILTTLLTMAVNYFGIGEDGILLEVAHTLISVAVITVLFAMMFKLLPDAEVRWGDVWLGAVITALLFTLGKYLLGLYIARSGIASVYGAAGSLVIVLIWVYYSAQILFLGAEFTQVYSKRHGERIAPTEDAVKVTEAERAQQGIPHEDTVLEATAEQLGAKEER
jgi:membrane protein